MVDWNIPFDGAAQGDRGFDVATLLFYTYDIEQTRQALWERALQLSGLARLLAIAEALLHDCAAQGA